MKQKKAELLMIRLDQILKDKLETIANKEQRSMSSYVRLLIARDIEEKEGKSQL